MASIHDNPRSSRPAEAPMSRARGGRWAAAGMTLIEMLVAISVLAVMILAVSSIMVQTQRFISAAQTSRRSHALAFTIARIIRRDIRRVSKDGFLYIDNNKLVFSTAGAVNGINESTSGDGSIICYGQQSATSGTSQTTYLWRPEYICNCTTGVPSPDVSGERVNVNFSKIQVLAAKNTDANSPFTLQMLADNVASTTPTGLRLPPTNATQLKNLWQVLVTNVNNLQISWTDGTKSGSNMNWLTTSALWTHQDQTNWPRAIRISFLIQDPLMPKEFRGTAYEVICTVGQ
jgi:prepilin-type N-terminal cleavage/methylation domain-containing protein